MTKNSKIYRVVLSEQDAPQLDMEDDPDYDECFEEELVFALDASLSFVDATTKISEHVDAMKTAKSVKITIVSVTADEDILVLN